MIDRQTVSFAFPVKPLGQVVEFLDSRRRPVRESDRQPGPFPYYGANGQQGTINDYIFDEPLVLLAEDGGYFDEPERGIAYRISGKSWVNNHAHVLRSRAGLDLNYLCRGLEHYDVTPYISGTTRSKLTKAQAEKIAIPLPPIKEQRRIGVVLDQADELRRKRRSALVEVDKLSRAVFVEMFGDPVLNVRQWPKRKLGEVGELERGVSKHRPRNDAALLNGPYPLIQTGDIANCDGYIRKYTSSYSEVGLRQSRLWSKGTLCITIAANIGKTGILLFDSCFPDSVVGFTPRDMVTTEYVQSWMSFIQRKLEDDAPEFAQKNINLAILRELEIPVPPMTLQADFASCIGEIDRLRTTYRGHLGKLVPLHRGFDRLVAPPAA